MNFTFFFKRPVFSTVINISIILIAFISFQQLNFREYPKMQFNTIVIKTQFQGSTAKNTNSQVTNIIQEAIAGINNIDYIKTIDSSEESTVILHLKLDANIDSVFIEVMEKVRACQERLPKSIRAPVIQRSNNETALMHILASSDSLSISEINEICSTVIKQKIERINGVAKVSSSANVTDGGSYSIKGIIDPLKLQKYNLSFKEVKHAIDSNFSRRPLGKFLMNNVAFSFQFKERFSSISDYESIVIKKTKDSTIYLKDLVSFEKYFADDLSTTRFNKKTLVAFSITLQSGANPINISKEVEKILKENEQLLPPEIKVSTFLDSSKSIEKNLNSVFQTIFEAIIFVLFILFLFLGSLRLSIIPLFSIPTSLSCGIIAIYLFGGSINILTLLAMVLAIGIVVDDSMVLAENIHKHMESGLEIQEACIKGLEEIQFAIIAMTLTLLAVYIPILFLKGVLGKLFIEFAICLSACVLYSGVFCLIYVPYLYYFLHSKAEHENPQKWYLVFLKYLKSFEEGYEIFLAQSFKFIKHIFVFIGFLALYTSLLYYQMPNNLLPSLDQNILRISLLGPNGMQMDYLNEYAKKIEEFLSEKTEVKSMYVSLSTHGQNMAIVVLDKNVNSKNFKEFLQQELNSLQNGLHADVQLYSNNLFESADQNQLSLNIVSPFSYDTMEPVIQQVKSYIGSLSECQSNRMFFSKINYEKSFLISINEEKAKLLGVEIQDIVELLAIISTGQPPVNTFINNNQQCYFKLIVSKELMENPEYFKQFSVKQSHYINQSRELHLISLDNLIKIEESSERSSLATEDKLTCYSLHVGLNENVSVSKLYKKIQTALKQMLPKGYLITPGDSLKKQFAEESNIYFLFLLALLFIYLILCAQFENFIDPFIIITTVPLSFIGALFVYSFKFNSEINIFVYIGLITLIGLITKHGILIVEFVNTLISEETEEITQEKLKEIVVKACLLRVRPILITTFAMFLGSLPLAISSGIGFEIRNALGWIIAGGILLGTIFTLIVLPNICLIVKKKQLKIK